MKTMYGILDKSLNLWEATAHALRYKYITPNVLFRQLRLHKENGV